MRIVRFLLIVSVTTLVCAQSNEIALTAGGYFSRHVNVMNDTLPVVEGNVARRLVHWPKAALFVELPIAGSLDTRAKAISISAGQSFGTRHYAALFVAPGVKVKLFPDSGISPYFAFGGGLAHFSKTGVPGSTNTNVIDFGGGADVKVNRLFAIRGEMRDFYSGPPQLIQGLLEREHQIVATGGIVLRF